MKRTFFIILLLAAIGLTASFYLIPHASELALIRYKDKQFDAARAIYEQQFKEGAVTPEVVNTLVDLYLQAGDVAGAVAVMEQFVAARPADIEARNRLGQLYQFAERPDDYLKNLEEMNRLQPSAETLKTLSQIYNYRADYARQAETLRELIKRHGEDTAQAYTDLANILATQKNAGAAIEALLSLQQRHPESFTFREEELLVSLLLDEKRYDDALAAAKAWRGKDPAPPPAEVARLVNMLHLRGTAPLGEQLLATYDDATIEASAPLLAERVLLMMNGGNEAEAYAKLKELYGKGALSSDMQNRLLFLAVLRGDEETAQTLIETLDIASLNEQQALALLELSLTKGDAGMQKRLTAHFGRDQYRAQYPLLAAMISVAARKADARERLEALAEADLAPQQELQVARICIRMRDYACGETFLSRLPEVDELSDGEIAAAAALYYELGAFDKGYALLSEAGSRSSPALETARVRFAAVRGDEKTVDAWLTTHAQDASLRDLTDLFFAARNHRQPKLAQRIAEHLYTREQSGNTRSMLSSAYIANGQYAKAATLLRGARDLSAEDEGNYLMALTRLSRTAPSYRKELGAYAGARLNAKLPEKQKLRLIYALIEARQIDAAMPHIRTLALREGGQWAWLYANQLDKQGKHEEAREFWLTLAHQSSTPPKQKRQIAFNLLNAGYIDDAEPLFRELAANAPAQSDDVRSLLYVWGPRLDAGQLDWLAARYNTAPDAEHMLWADYIATYASSDEIVPLAEQRHPETLFAGPVWHRYIETLAQAGELQNKHDALLRGAAEYGNPGLLGIYAEVARAHDYKREARQAYEALFALDPNDNNALYQLGMVSFGQADYTASRMYLDEYLRGPAANDSAERAASAAFYYGELLRRERRLSDPMKSAAPYYEQTVTRLDQGNANTPASLSQKAQSLIYLGRTEEGLALFAHASASAPDNDMLRADYATALVQLKRYGEARALIAEPLAEPVHPQTAETLTIPSGALIGYTMLSDGSEALLSVQGSEQDIRQLASNAEELPWVGYAATAYRRLLIAAKPGYTLRVTRNPDGVAMLTPEPTATDKARRQLRLRYELLAARIDVETGRLLAATQRLNALMPEYPNDAQLIGFAANAEHYSGNWPRAQALLKTAHALAPENEDVALLSRDVNRTYGNGVKLDHEWIKRGDDDENITTVSAVTDVNSKIKAGVVMQNNRVHLDVLKPLEPFLGTSTRNRKRGEVYAQYHGENGKKAKASLFANEEVWGMGLYGELLNPLGLSGGVLEYRKPYWDIDASTAFFKYTRDRVSVWHEIRPNTQLSLRLEPGLNRYSMHDMLDLRAINFVKSYSVDGNATYRPISSMPFLYLSYGLSLEKYSDPLTLRMFESNQDYREIHFLALTTGHDFDDATYASLMVGYGYDRAEHSGGPSVEGRITHEFDEHIDAQLRAAYGFDTKSGGDDTARLGGYLRYRF